MFGMFSCPSGKEVSRSRAQPPNVTTTTFFLVGTFAAREQAETVWVYLISWVHQRAVFDHPSHREGSA
jgi:hypothetical protein